VDSLNLTLTFLHFFNVAISMKVFLDLVYFCKAHEKKKKM